MKIPARSAVRRLARSAAPGSAEGAAPKALRSWERLTYVKSGASRERGGSSAKTVLRHKAVQEVRGQYYPAPRDGDKIGKLLLFSLKVPRVYWKCGEATRWLLRVFRNHSTVVGAATLCLFIVRRC